MQDGGAFGLWFADSQVKIRLSGTDNPERLSVLEHRMARGFSPPWHVHHDEGEAF